MYLKKCALHTTAHTLNKPLLVLKVLRDSKFVLLHINTANPLKRLQTDLFLKNTLNSTPRKGEFYDLYKLWVLAQLTSFCSAAPSVLFRLFLLVGKRGKGVMQGT
ncbi:UNVERIFIED_CONTAM: hypothetical protein K2H54_055210 [Gekko kuhli]